ncbi:hypothetical protein KSS87_001187, partial [Heliosperma pusillum]
EHKVLNNLKVAGKHGNGNGNDNDNDDDDDDNGSTVSVTCLDERKRVACYKSDKTDDDGEFNMVMEKMVHGKKLNPKNCIVRLVSSPDPSCNVATNFAQGKTGVKLRQPSVVYRDITKYRLG